MSSDVSKKRCIGLLQKNIVLSIDLLRALSDVEGMELTVRELHLSITSIGKQGSLSPQTLNQ